MKLSITGALEAQEKAPFVLRGVYEDIIPLAKSIGYPAIEMHILDSEQIDRENLKELLAQNNLALSSIGTGFAYGQEGLRLTSEDPVIRRKAVDRIKGHILTAKDHHAVVIIGLIRGLIKECSSKEIYLKLLHESLYECLQFAEQYQITLAVELLNRYESDFLNTIEEGLEFLDTFQSDYLKLHLDTYHMNIEEQDCRQSILNAKDKIGHVHISDNDRWYAGHGHFDFEETVRALRDVGYSGALAAETFQFPNSVESATHSYHYMKKILDEVL